MGQRGAKANWFAITCFRDWKATLGRYIVTIRVVQQHVSWMKWAAATIGVVTVFGEALIAIATLLSGYLFGFYDVVGVVLGVSATILVWKRPAWACLFWLGEEVMLFNGHLLVSVACLPMLLLPLSSAALGMWSWSVS